MQEILNKYNLVIFDYSDTLISSDLNCPLISREVLLEIKSKGKRLAVFTASDLSEIENNITNYFSAIFDVIVTKDSVKNTKPDPEGLSLILKNFKIDKELALFIGDSDSDIQAAKAAGVEFISIDSFLKLLN